MKNIAVKLNPYLADLTVFYHKLHDLHWNVKGKMFVQVHEYTDARYEDMAEKFDAVAELMVMNGEAPVTSMKEYLEMASIKELNRGRYSDEEVLKIVLEDLTALRDEALELRAYFGENDVFEAVNMLEDHIEGYEKEIWFLSSMMA